jgi:hypothetical protein
MGLVRVINYYIKERKENSTEKVVKEKGVNALKIKVDVFDPNACARICGVELGSGRNSWTGTGSRYKLLVSLSFNKN